ncbi:MAG TPA: hypothetical protein VD761_10240 [Solirubrobacterales bacterium]|nr:hypothetical protein [Solirubrobacterales bacterium]
MSLVVALVVAGTLAACGGEGEDTTTTGTAPERPSAAQPAPADDGADRGAGGGGGAGGSAAGARPDPAVGDDAGSGGQDKAQASIPDPLTTDPESVRGARVTATGAVQTLPPDEAAQETAMENSYSSIKAYGSEAEGSEATEISFALVQYLSARAEGDWSTACARIYSVLRGTIERAGRSCPEVYGDLMSRTPAATRASAAMIDVASVRRGDDARAFVIYKTPDVVSADMPMYLDQGVWTVGALEAYALTPEQLQAAGAG